MNLSKIPKGACVHLVGIGGAGMRAIALILMDQGYKVTGSDIDTERELVRDLIKRGAEVMQGNDPQHITNPQLVVTSTAIKPDNPEVLEALRLGIPVLNRSDVFSFFQEDKKLIAVAGTHGKTTTSAMISWAMLQAGINPTYYFGSPYIRGEQACWTDSDYFVMETDESDKSFLKFNADFAVVTNIDRDHMETYNHSLDELISTFARFLEQSVEKKGYQILNCDDENITKIKLSNPKNINLFGRSKNAHIRAGNSRTFVDDYDLCTETEIFHGNKFLGNLVLHVPGEHNIMDGLAAICAGFTIGFDPKTFIENLKSYPGTQRRLELMGVANGHPVYDDYAHHPTAIKAGLDALRLYYTDKPICLVMQPFRFMRASYLPHEYAQCIRGADRIIITEVFPKEENHDERSQAVAQSIMDENPDKNIIYSGSLGQTPEVIIKGIKKDEIIYLAGPYPIRSIANPLLEML
jgi:UDP-N-acetylmuramate--alanine ligase